MEVEWEQHHAGYEHEDASSASEPDEAELEFLAQLRAKKERKESGATFQNVPNASASSTPSTRAGGSAASAKVDVENAGAAAAQKEDEDGSQPHALTPEQERELDARFEELVAAAGAGPGAVGANDAVAFSASLPRTSPFFAHPEQKKKSAAILRLEARTKTKPKSAVADTNDKSDQRAASSSATAGATGAAASGTRPSDNSSNLAVEAGSNSVSEAPLSAALPASASSDSLRILAPASSASASASASVASTSASAPASTPASAPASASERALERFARLPNEVLLQVFACLRPKDAVRLLFRTSRALHLRFLRAAPLLDEVRHGERARPASA